MAAIRINRKNEAKDCLPIELGILRRWVNFP